MYLEGRKYLLPNAAKVPVAVTASDSLVITNYFEPATAYRTAVSPGMQGILDRCIMYLAFEQRHQPGGLAAISRPRRP